MVYVRLVKVKCMAYLVYFFDCFLILISLYSGAFVLSLCVCKCLRLIWDRVHVSLHYCYDYCYYSYSFCDDHMFFWTVSVTLFIKTLFQNWIGTSSFLLIGRARHSIHQHWDWEDRRLLQEPGLEPVPFQLQVQWIYPSVTSHPDSTGIFFTS